MHAGWDVFSLRYSVDEPLATVLTDAAAAQIQAVARLLWALKRAEHSLSAAWLLLNTTQRSLTRLAAKTRRLQLSSRGTCSTPLLPVLPLAMTWVQVRRTLHSVRLAAELYAHSLHWKVGNPCMRICLQHAQDKRSVGQSIIFILFACRVMLVHSWTMECGRISSPTSRVQ